MIKREFLVISALILFGCSKKVVEAGSHGQSSEIVQPSSNRQATQDKISSDHGKEYLVQSSPIGNFNSSSEDGVAVVKTADNNFAVLQPGESYKFSWFKKGSESDDVTLQRALDFIHFVRIDKKNVSNGKISETVSDGFLIGKSTSGTLFIDQNITLRSPIKIYENITLKGDFTASNDNNFRSNTIFIDLKDDTKPAIKFIRFPGSQLNYVSAKIEGIRFSVLSACSSVVDMEGASGEVMKNVMISGNNYATNGIEISSAIFCKLSNSRVEKVLKYGLLVKNTPLSLSTTTEIDHFSVSHGEIGIYVQHKSCNSLWLKNCTVEETSSSAVKIEQFNYVHIDNLYTENVINETLKEGFIPIIDINSKDFGTEIGNRGLVTVTNSILIGYREKIPTRKIVGIRADNLEMLSVTGCIFSEIDQSIVMKSKCGAVNWFNNMEGGWLNVYNAMNHGVPFENGIENPNAMNIISSYSSSSGKYEPYSRTVSQRSRLYTPIILSSDTHRFRIAEEGIDEAKNFVEMWVQHGQQQGEMRVAPGGKNVAATFGTNGGLTIGNDLLSAPPKDGLHVNGQAIFGNGNLEKSAAVQVESTDKGFLPPRLSTVQRDAISAPVAGLIIFNTTVSKHQGYNGSKWNDLY
jgi:hypothetical protein